MHKKKTNENKHGKDIAALLYVNVYRSTLRGRDRAERTQKADNLAIMTYPCLRRSSARKNQMIILARSRYVSRVAISLNLLKTLASVLVQKTRPAPQMLAAARPQSRYMPRLTPHRLCATNVHMMVNVQIIKS